ncbi:MAG: hypothetical protein AAGA23_03840 [Pseudomonadota bacterium]
MDDGKRDSSSATATGCLTVFGSVFLLIGLLAGFFVSRGVLQAWQIQSWVPASGTLIELTIDTSRSSSSFDLPVFPGDRLEPLQNLGRSAKQSRKRPRP